VLRFLAESPDRRLAPLEIHGLKFYLKDAEKRKMADVFVKGCSCGRGRICALVGVGAYAPYL